MRALRRRPARVGTKPVHGPGDRRGQGVGLRGVGVGNRKICFAAARATYVVIGFTKFYSFFSFPFSVHAVPPPVLYRRYRTGGYVMLCCRTDCRASHAAATVIVTIVVTTVERFVTSGSRRDCIVVGRVRCRRGHRLFCDARAWDVRTSSSSSSLGYLRTRVRVCVAQVLGHRRFASLRGLDL
uniref:Uncharacterized protein n=1 Tax=Sipha flava TaxID=143950 RepID=A0A2S2QQA7_9HEMI